MNTRVAVLLLLFVLCCGLLADASPLNKQETYIPAQGQTYSPTEDYLKQIATSVASIDKRLERLEKAGTPAATDGWKTVVADRCLKCHQDGVAQDKGDGFVLVEKDGSLAELSLAEKRRIIRMVSQGKMPPSGKLPENEAKILTDYFAPEKEKK